MTIKTVTYAINSAMDQARYLNLAAAGEGERLTDSDAAGFLYREFGFAVDAVRIVREAPIEERAEIVDGPTRVRVVGTVPRDPVRVATDWNYVRFESRGITWECVNGALEQIPE